MKNKWLIALTICILFTLSVPVYGETTDLGLTAETAVLINGDSGQIIYNKNAHVPMFPASTTKILTAIIVIEDLELTDMVEIDAEATRAGGSHIALVPGELVSVKDLLNALLIASANDAAVALAKYHSGSVENFAKVMNERAKTMGAVNSNFVNPHGLPNPEHLTTAYDLAMIAKYAMKNQTFKNIAATRRYEIAPTNKQPEIRYLNSTNSLFQGMAGSNKNIDINGQSEQTAYEYADGIKRGYTEDAQYCFIGSAVKDNRRLITVVLKSTADAMYQDTRRMMNYGFNATKTYAVHDSKSVLHTIPMQNKKGTKINTVAEGGVSVDLPLEATPEAVEEKIVVNNNIELPVAKGEVLGTVDYFFKGQMILQKKLIADDDYVGDILLGKETYYYTKEKFIVFRLSFWRFLLFRGFIALFVWRGLMTVIRLTPTRKRFRRNPKTANRN